MIDLLDKQNTTSASSSLETLPAYNANKSKWTPLHYATCKGAPFEVLTSLIPKNPKALDSKNGAGLTPRHYLFALVDDERSRDLLEKSTKEICRELNCTSSSRNCDTSMTQEKDTLRYGRIRATSAVVEASAERAGLDTRSSSSINNNNMHVSVCSENKKHDKNVKEDVVVITSVLASGESFRSVDTQKIRNRASSVTTNSQEDEDYEEEEEEEEERIRLLEEKLAAAEAEANLLRCKLASIDQESSLKKKKEVEEHIVAVACATKDLSDSDSISISEQHLKLVERLDHTCISLQKRLDVLEKEWFRQNSPHAGIQASRVQPITTQVPVSTVSLNNKDDIAAKNKRKNVSRDMLSLLLKEDLVGLPRQSLRNHICEESCSSTTSAIPNNHDLQFRRNEIKKPDGSSSQSLLGHHSLIPSVSRSNNVSILNPHVADLASELRQSLEAERRERMLALRELRELIVSSSSAAAASSSTSCLHGEKMKGEKRIEMISLTMIMVVPLVGIVALLARASCMFQ